SDFGASRRDDRDERGLARIREADQSNIGEQLQLQAKMPLLAGKTIFMFARGLMPGLGKMLIAAAAAPALRDQHALSRNGEISNGFARLLVVGERADGNGQDHVSAGLAAAIR